MYKRFTFVFLLLIPFLSVAVGLSVKKATVNKIPAKVQFDTSVIVAKKFNAAAIKAYRNDKEFNYNGQAVGQPSLWDRFWDWLWSKLTRLFSSIPYSGPLLKYLLLSLAVALLIFVIFKSLGIDPIQIFRGETKKINVPYTESLENIHEISFDAEIEKAISQHNYRLAVRLLYLKCLKQLSDNSLIKWEIDKTNSAYLYELKNADQKQTFGLLTRQFEYVWYGDFAIDQKAFGTINQLFQNFRKQLP